MTRIAFLGTGLLGGAFAEGAAKRGEQVSVWNRSPAKAKALEAFGVSVAASPAEAVRGVARVHLILKDDAVVEEVLAAALPGMSAGTVIIDHTTTLPTLTAERIKRLNGQGINYLHCPVFMGPPAARNAQGSMLVAGPKALFEEVREELAKMTGRIEYLGERGDVAAANKLFGNAMIIGVAAVIADILTIAQASDVDGVDAIKLLGLLDLNAMVSGRGMNMAKGNFAPSFELAMARKDVRLMLETAGDRPMAALPGVAARMDELIAAGRGGEDCTIIAEHALSRP